MVNSKKETSMAEEFLFVLIATNTRVSGRMTNNKEQQSKPIQEETDTSFTTKTVNVTATQSCITQMVA